MAYLPKKGLAPPPAGTPITSFQDGILSARRRTAGTPAPSPPPGTPPHRRGPQPPAAPTAPAPDPLDYFNALIKDLAPNSASLISLEAKLNEAGIKVLRNAGGIAGKIKLPSGEIVDVGQNFSSNNPASMRWQALRSDKRYKNGVLIGTPPALPPKPGEQAIPRGSTPPAYPAAYAAAQRQRQHAGGVGSRGSTILGGFGGGPRTRPTILGRAG